MSEKFYNENDSLYRQMSGPTNFDSYKTKERINVGIISKFGFERNIKEYSTFSIAYNFYFDNIIRFDTYRKAHGYYSAFELTYKVQLCQLKNFRTIFTKI